MSKPAKKLIQFIQRIDKVIKSIGKNIGEIRDISEDIRKEVKEKKDEG